MDAFASALLVTLENDRRAADECQFITTTVMAETDGGDDLDSQRDERIGLAISDWLRSQYPALQGDTETSQGITRKVLDTFFGHVAWAEVGRSFREAYQEDTSP